MAKAVVDLSEDSTRHFVERLTAELLPKGEDPESATVPQQVRVLDVRRPSFLRQGCLVQAEVVYSDKTMVLWCLFIDGETNTDGETHAVLVAFPDRRESIADVIERVDKEGGSERIRECIRIDTDDTITDYVVEFINHELAHACEAG